MTLRARLRRLERMAPGAGTNAPGGDHPLAGTGQHAAYLQGERPRPPDPPVPRGFDPAAWASRWRLCRCLEECLTGALREGAYLPEMGAEERCYVDRLLRACASFRRHLPADHLEEPYAC